MPHRQRSIERTEGPRRKSSLLRSPSTTRYERGLSYSRSSSIERLNDLSGESAIRSPSFTSKKALRRKNSYDRVKKHEVRDQLPLFGPNSKPKADIKRNASFDRLSQSSTKLSRESSFSESASKDLDLDGNEGGNAVNQLPGSASESASAGMHRTRSTDWYEICLKEEEEEEMRVLARKQEEEESKLGSSQKNTPASVRNLSNRPSSSNRTREECQVLRPSLITGENHREAKNLGKGWSQERFVREDVADSAQPVSHGKRNAGAGGKQGLFTPWNALQAVPASRGASLGAPRSNPVETSRDSPSLSASRSTPVEISRDNLGTHQNSRVSIVGGQQEARGRRVVSANDPDEPENWRTERRLSRHHSKEAVVTSDLPRECRAGPSGHALSKQTNQREGAVEYPFVEERRPSRHHSREAVVRSDLPRESRAGLPGRALPKQTNERKGAVEDRFVGERRPLRYHSRETVVRSDLPRESRAVLSGRVLPKQTNEREWTVEDGFLEGRRPSRHHSREAVVRSDLPRESRAVLSGRALPKQTNEWEGTVENAFLEGRRPSRHHSREAVVRSDLPRESRAGLSGRALPKQANEREGAVEDPLVESAKREPAIFVKRVNGSIRPATFYHALHEALAGDDDPLPHIVGTCPDMCPGKERLQRERLRDLAVYERVSGDLRKTSKDLAVKKFCRTVVASELESTDVRPLPVLWRTQQYLLGLLDDPEFSFDVVHNFLFDRTRAVRQELGMQRILDYQSITIHEEIVRFHILSEHELRDLNRKRSKQFDTHLNLQQLSKSLYSLLNLYISLEGKDGAQFENEAEFHAYYVLLNLGNHGRFQAEPLSLWFPNVPSHVLEGVPMQFARKALRFHRSNNFTGFFRSVRKATFLQACLLELNFDSVRAMALDMLNVASYKLHPYPLSDLAKQLILEENEVDELCMYYGLLTGVDNGSQKLCLLAKQGQFSFPEKESLPQHGCPLINSKRAPSCFQEVKGSKAI